MRCPSPVPPGGVPMRSYSWRRHNHPFTLSFLEEVLRWVGMNEVHKAVTLFLDTLAKQPGSPWTQRWGLIIHRRKCSYCEEQKHKHFNLLFVLCRDIIILFNPLDPKGMFFFKKLPKLHHLSQPEARTLLSGKTTKSKLKIVIFHKNYFILHVSFNISPKINLWHYSGPVKRQKFCAPRATWLSPAVTAGWSREERTEIEI